MRSCLYQTRPPASAGIFPTVAALSWAPPLRSPAGQWCTPSAWECPTFQPVGCRDGQFRWYARALCLYCRSCTARVPCSARLCCPALSYPFARQGRAQSGPGCHFCERAPTFCSAWRHDARVPRAPRGTIPLLCSACHDPTVFSRELIMGETEGKHAGTRTGVHAERGSCEALGLVPLWPGTHQLHLAFSAIPRFPAGRLRRGLRVHMCSERRSISSRKVWGSRIMLYLMSSEAFCERVAGERTE